MIGLFLLFIIAVGLVILTDGLYQERKQERARQLYLHQEIANTVKHHTGEGGEEED